MRSISDKAAVSVDFPDKTYMGSFGRESSFDVKVEAEEALLRMVRAGDERREIGIHLHYYLLADILKEIGQRLSEQDFLDDAHREALGVGVAALTASLKGHAARKPRQK